MSQPRPLVLVVDDEADLLTVIRMTLEGVGLRVATAQDGSEALSRLRQEMPQLILLDLRMPVVDGRAFMKELRAHHGHPCPVIVFSAAEDPASAARELAADGFLGKPFDLSELIATTRRGLGLS